MSMRVDQSVPGRSPEVMRQGSVPNAIDDRMSGGRVDYHPGGGRFEAIG